MLIAATFGIIAAACGGGTTASTSDAIEAQSTSDVAETEGTSDSSDAPAATSDLFAGDFVDLRGETVNLAEYEGQDVVLWYWAPR